VGGDHSEVPVAGNEDERRGPVHDAGLDEPAAFVVHAMAVVTGPRLPADIEGLAAGSREGSAGPSPRSRLDHIQQSLLHERRDLRPQAPLAHRRPKRDPRLEGRALGEAHLLDPHDRKPDAVVQDDARELGERQRSVSGAPDRRPQGRREVVEREAEVTPAGVDSLEGLDLQHRADARVLRMGPRRSQEPTVHVDQRAAAGRQKVIERGSRMMEPV
jgi:hypothetical protein